MRPFMFLCPNTGYIVHGQADDAAPGEKPCTFHPVSCASCGRSHLVDPVTAELAVQSGNAGVQGVVERSCCTLLRYPPPEGLARLAVSRSVALSQSVQYS
jgi:hypothetical protein